MNKKINPDQMYWFNVKTDDREWTYGAYGKDLTKIEREDILKRGVD